MFLATWMYFSSTAIGFLFVADASFHMICFDDQALKPNWVIHSFWAPVTVLLQSHCVTMPVPVEIENMLKVASCEKLCLSCWLFEILPYLSRFGLKSECTRTFELIVHSFFPNPCFSWWADGRVCFLTWQDRSCWPSCNLQGLQMRPGIDRGDGSSVWWMYFFGSLRGHEAWLWVKISYKVRQFAIAGGA